MTLSLVFGETWLYLSDLALSTIGQDSSNSADDEGLALEHSENPIGTF